MPYKRTGPVQICPQCGATFTAPDLRPQTHCSRACLVAAHWSPTAVAARFWAKVDTSGDCWLWTGKPFPNGYGDFPYIRGRHGLAHRYAYELLHGPIPNGVLVCHDCPGVHNRMCVRHLKLGTYADNNWDTVHQGMKPAGERHWHSKLTDAQTAMIRERHAAGERGSVLASAFGVSRALVSMIVNHKVRVARQGTTTEARLTCTTKSGQRPLLE